MHRRILATETDPPDLVARGSLYQYRVARVEQMVAQRLALAEFGDVPCDHQIEAGRAPASVIIVAHGPTDLLASKRFVSIENGRESLQITEQTRLGRHHPLLSPVVADAIDLEFCWIELAEDRIRNTAQFRCMAIEGQIRKALAVADASTQCLKVQRQAVVHALLRSYAFYYSYLSNAYARGRRDSSSNGRFFGQF